MNRLNFVYSAIAALAITMTGCPGEGPGNILCGTGFLPASGTVGDFGNDQNALQFEAFLGATGDVYRQAIEAENNILTACQGIATDLAIPAGELQPTGEEFEVTATCRRVAQEIESILTADLPTDIGLGIAITPPVCTIDLELAATCAAECDLAIEANAEAVCDGALYGSCTGNCTGQCTFDGSAACDGVCTARCTGACAGRCTGTCDGTCDVVDEEGNCAGVCQGTCEGTCEGGCSGTCDGTCVVEVSGGCEGECRGSCDVGWEAECTGEANVDARADCKAACDVSANANAVCTDPEITVVDVGVADVEAAARLADLVIALSNNLPLILKAQAQLETGLAPSLVAFQQSLEGSLDAAGDLGTQAVACGVVAIDSVIQTLASVNASIEVSIEISAAVTVQGGA